MSLARRLGGATRQHALLELQDALVDVEGVRHHDRVRDALPVELAVRAGALGVLGAIARGVLGGNARQLAKEAGGVGAQASEDFGDQRDDLLPALEGLRRKQNPKFD